MPPRTYEPEDDDFDEEDYDEQEDDDAVELVRCPECRREIPEFTDRCPYCENWIVSGAVRPAPWIRIVGVLALLAMVVFVLRLAC